jgi:polar amino acid transport system permease protein
MRIAISLCVLALLSPAVGRTQSVAPTIGFVVQLVKTTSLAAIIGFIELVHAGQFINNATLQSMPVYGFVGCIFFVLCWPLSKLSQGLEARLGRGFQPT